MSEPLGPPLWDPEDDNPSLLSQIRRAIFHLRANNVPRVPDIDNLDPQAFVQFLCRPFDDGKTYEAPKLTRLAHRRQSGTIYWDLPYSINCSGKWGQYLWEFGSEWDDIEYISGTNVRIDPKTSLPQGVHAHPVCPVCDAEEIAAQKAHQRALKEFTNAL